MTQRILLGLCVLLTSAYGQASTDLPATAIKREAIQDQFVMAFASQQPVTNISQFAGLVNLPFFQASSFATNNQLKVLVSRHLAANSFRTQVLVKKSEVGRVVWDYLSKHPRFLKMQPNYRYTGELREDVVEPQTEVVPNDPQYAEQYHHSVMKNDLAWANLGEVDQKIIVAVTDDGVDIDHEDLKDAIYINPNEIPGNGVDDDNNGYVDDVNGWDFAKGDNDPRPTSFNEHGTHVSGIIAATGNNGVGIVGTADQAAEIMPIRFYGGAFTSDIVAEAYTYAADNGANIITTSYNIDSFVGDQVFEDAVAYVYSKGVLHFNSAGNAGQSGPRRGAFRELILVCSTIADEDDNDKRSSFSNYGAGVDICSPGGGGSAGILSTVNDNKYERMSGTSMAAPNAAAVAAVIWAKNPSWNREQVVAQLYGTAVNIDGLNPGFENQLGFGRTDTAAALTENIKSIGVTNVSNVKAGNTHEIKISFNNVLDPKTVVARHFKVMDGNTTLPVQLAEEYKMGSNEIVLTFSHAGSVDKLIIEDFVLTPFGEPIDGDNDGLPGGDFVANL